MLEYFAYKKYKKTKSEKAAEEQEDDNRVGTKSAETSDETASFGNPPAHTNSTSASRGADPVLNPEDELFLENLLDQAGPAPPLPPRPQDWQLDWSSDSDAASTRKIRKVKNEDKDDNSVTGKGKERDIKEDKEPKKANRFSIFFSKSKGQQDSKNKKTAAPGSEGLEPEDNVSNAEAKRESNDLSQVLDRLNLSAKNNKVVNLSNESSQLLARFTQIFKDLVNGVPTAYDDLTILIEDRDGVISRNFDKLPSSLKKLVTRLPEKLTSTLAPEILVAAAEAQGLKTSAEGGVKGAAKKLFLPQNLSQLVTKPGALIGMLRAIVEALKARWPAFMGMNVVWSIALSLLLFLLWYCHKRGREVRLENDKTDETPIDGTDRVEELPDDPTLPAPPDHEATGQNAKDTVAESLQASGSAPALSSVK